MADGIVFPKDFLWGSAQSAYQVEGTNYNND
ncbi:MAG: family 1 glycosylhydrolase [Candidatus Heimdallarchaeota archaeon]|nr:family 1 glycosylhydrolase [Candidatus Heimdallarchaeota archaeon]MCK5143244.1 family 1 glycosylhydrolase [Candidatus Heimdallarchaeota archaeon]